MMNKIRVYKDSAQEWRWQITAEENNLIIGASTEGYKNEHNEHDCKSNLKRITGVNYPKEAKSFSYRVK